MKKKMKLLLAGFLAAAAMSGCVSKDVSDTTEGVNANMEPLGGYSEPVEVSIGKGIDPNYKFNGEDTAENNVYTRWLKKEYNIHVKHEWEAASADYEQKVSLSIASNDLPDAMMVNESQLKQMIKADQLADLSEVYKKAGAPRLKAIYDSNPGLLENVTYEGKLYALPETTLPSAPMTWIRKDWLDELGLKEPKSLEDLKTIAKAFIDNKMGGENTVGIVGTAQGGSLYSTFLTSGDHSFNLSPLFFANDAYPGIWVKDKDGQAVYGSTTPETKKTLGMLRDWYKEGLIDKELGLRKSAQEVIVSGKAGIFFGPWHSPYSIQDAIKNDPKANWRPYLAPVDDSGKFNSNETTGSQYIVVNKNFKNPEAIIKMLNIHVSEKAKSYEKEVADRQMTSQEIPLFIIAGHGDQLEYAVSSTQKHLAGEVELEEIDKINYGFAYDLSAHAKNVKKEPYDNYDIQYWDKQGDEAFFSHVYAHLNGGSTFVNADINYVRSLATAKTKTMESRWANLSKLEDETFLKIIFGTAPLSEFDSFVKKWNKQGGKQITKEVNEQ
ncbi:extracellular solute-binding protein [Metabacillus indicus]|uniref:extracellular solute-binding protein n=1 Tax=Metabacillus indicus TaxID=246786 RepID=UPI000493762D|nr:extracellular solute-binding protein [Metabacillus indicus]KEZ52461.1 sugar ABC transporter substrate-binding protein [Metabacillus indicus LMG 22858]